MVREHTLCCFYILCLLKFVFRASTWSLLEIIACALENVHYADGGGTLGLIIMLFTSSVSPAWWSPVESETLKS